MIEEAIAVVQSSWKRKNDPTCCITDWEEVCKELPYIKQAYDNWKSAEKILDACIKELDS